jgi:hypothetical protein
MKYGKLIVTACICFTGIITTSIVPSAPLKITKNQTEPCRLYSYQGCKVGDKPGHACMPEPGKCKKIMECRAISTLPVSATHEQILFLASEYVNELVAEDYICPSEYNETVQATVDRIYHFYSTGN